MGLICVRVIMEPMRIVFKYRIPVVVADSKVVKNTLLGVARVDFL